MTDKERLEELLNDLPYSIRHSGELEPLKDYARELAERVRELEEELYGNDIQMTDKELLEEIIENVEEIMETPYVVRKEKAVEVGIELIMTGKVDFLLRKIDSLEKQNKRYREALEFYADEENYKPFDGIFLSSYQNKIDEDGGKKARQALEVEQ